MWNNNPHRILRLSLQVLTVTERQLGGAFQFLSNRRGHSKAALWCVLWAGGEVFQFPSNGKVDPKSVWGKNKSLYSEGFNSLQMGKRIHRETYAKTLETHQGVSIPFKRESGSKDLVVVIIDGMRRGVSIPFKRESGSKGARLAVSRFSWRVSIPFKRESGSKASLRTERAALVRISIPFKRESGSKV